MLLVQIVGQSNGRQRNSLKQTTVKYTVNTEREVDQNERKRF